MTITSEFHPRIVIDSSAIQNPFFRLRHASERRVSSAAIRSLLTWMTFPCTKQHSVEVVSPKGSNSNLLATESVSIVLSRAMKD